MKIAIVGGTGTLGRRTAAELRLRGHSVRVLSRGTREYHVDLATGEGLEPAMHGCNVVVDASNDSTKKAVEILVEGSRRLLAAERAAGVSHHVCVSIVGCELVPLGYFRVKNEQEQVVDRGPVPWTIVRATQFHELIAATLAQAAGWPVVPVPRAAVQPIACAEVARAVADAAECAPRRRRVDVAGPEVADAMELARTWRSVTGRQLRLVPVPLPGKLGRALRAGALTTTRPEISGTLPFAAWLQAEQA